MKNIVLFLLLWVAAVNVANSQLQLQSVKAKVGKQPIAIIPAKISGSFGINPDTLNIICLGYDANFNGEFDEADGDELPSWWKIERTINANPFLLNPQPFTVRKVMDFDMNWDGFFPYRMRIPEAIDYYLHYVPIEFGNVLPIPYKDRIVFYDMSTEEKLELDDYIIFDLLDSNIKSGCVYQGDVFFTTQRLYDNPLIYTPSSNLLNMYFAEESGIEKIISYESPNQYIQRVIAYLGFVDEDEAHVVAVLYEGELNSVVEFHTLKADMILPEMTWEDCFDIKEVNVGFNANDMVLLNPNGVPYLFVVSSGDNRIYIIDGLEQEINGYGIGIDSNYIQIPAEAPNSIREVSFKLTPTSLFPIQYILSATITSYDGNLYYIQDIFTSTDFENENENNMIIPSDGILSDASYLFENIWDGSGLFFARTLNMNDWYEPMDEVEIFYSGYTSITENSNSLKIFPNPVNSIINIELEDMYEINSIRLINSEGKLLQTLTNYSVDGNTIQINVSNLQTGSYFIELATKHGRYIQKFILK
ncbi:MAG: T9SS type A sorting domain-containing protein [Bacteroidetes bacterium]|nr:T9SS type A sorting domain-containing protein [Bacteroidota bacterium]